MSIFSATSAIIIGAILSLTFRSLKLSAPSGMSLLLPLCFILKIETMLLVLIVIGSMTPPAKNEHCPNKTNLRPAIICLPIVCLSSIIIVISLAEFQLIIDKVQFLALGVLSITAVICLQAYIMPISNDNKIVKPRLLSLFLSMMSAIIGLAIPTIGIDVGTGIQRYSFEITELYGGVDFIIIVMGLCCIGEILYSASNQFVINSDSEQNFIAYGTRRTADLTQSANCRPYYILAEILLAATLGIPFSKTSAIIVGTFALYGIQFPNSLRSMFQYFETAYDVALISVLFVILAYAVPALSKRASDCFVHKDEAARVKTKNMNSEANWRSYYMSPIAFYPIFAVAAFLGAYSIHYRLFDMYLLIAFGLAGFLMRRLNFPITPLIVCAAFGYRIEEAYRTPFSWTYPTAIFYLLSCIVLAIYIKIAVKPDSDY